MATYQELLAQRAVLEAKIDAAQLEQRNTALAEVKRLVSKFGIAAGEIYGTGRGRRKRQRIRAKYRDPATGATWSGRGRPPAWINGKDRAQFEIT
ncbi:H-NS family nucleoid-associated regulatory protein [Burkholderia ubonensis]|uniref:H-NS histone family protein n=1 Tax=Burkholderia ubonensis TaxID=101571 RepID=UPI0009B2EDB0|nr:H-NS histone family protein [Burkholderia ubonensis]